MIATLAILIGSALLAAIFGFTAMRYADLPDRIPIHFGLDGSANSFGPRVTAWLLPFISLMIAAIFGGIFLGGRAEVPLALPVVMLAVFLYVQVQMLGAAASGSNRIDPRGIWVGLAAIVVFVTMRHLR